MSKCQYCSKELEKSEFKPRKWCDRYCAKKAFHDKWKDNKSCVKCSSPIDGGNLCFNCKGPRTKPLVEFSDLKKDSSRKYRLKSEQKFHHCEMEDCLQTLWKGLPIPLELDHIDGNPSNNTRENLRLVCPNCHAMLPTHRGKNIGKNKNTNRSNVMKRYKSYRT